MKVKYFIGGYDKNICYLLWCEESKHAAIIDPAVEINPIIDFIENNNLILDKILITHSHHDHIKYLYDLIDFFNLIKVYISKKSYQEFNLQYKNQNTVFSSLSNNQIVNVGKGMLTVLETPGHYYDSICIWDIKNRRIFTGDTMFIGRTGRILSKKSSIDDLYHSIYNVLLKLPHNTMIYSGHDYGYKTLDTIENNIVSSDFFTCQNLSQFRIVMNNYEKNRKKR